MTSDGPAMTPAMSRRVPASPGARGPVAAAYARARRRAVRPWSATSRPASPPSTGPSQRCRCMAEAGCDVIEVGLPYSDPVMDGPTIQAAAQQALDARRPHHRRAEGRGGGRRTRGRDAGDDLLEPGRTLRRGPLRGRPRQRAGGAGLITPDLTPDEAAPWLAASQAHGLDRVFLVAPSSTDARIRYTTEHCRGFVYATAVMGVTGARDSTSELAAPLVARMRRATDLPVGVGLGVSDGDQAAAVAGYADGVIVGLRVRPPGARRRRRPDRGPGRTSRALTEDLADGVRRG